MPNNNIRPELSATVFGLQARFFDVVQNTDTGRILNQTIGIHGRQITGYDNGAMLSVKLRFDDSCKNGHESFSITGEVRIPKRDVVACGCLHEDIARVFPELEPIIKWHLTSTDGPMHYVANTCYHAGDRDSNGKRKGEPRRHELRVKFGSFPIYFEKPQNFCIWLREALDHNAKTFKTNPSHKHFEVVEVTHKEHPEWVKFSFDDYTTEWHKCPFNSRLEAEQWREAMRFDISFPRVPIDFSEGKARDLNAARSAAVWPDATDDELCQERPQLEAALRGRLPALLAEFKRDMLKIGFIYPGEPDAPPT